MNLRETLRTKDNSTAARAAASSTWIERFAVPIVLSVMEAQPVAVILALLTRTFIGARAAPSLGAGTIALLALGLLWWAMLVPHFTRDPARKKFATSLHLLSWITAFAIFVGPYLPSVAVGINIFPALFNTAIITWFWRQSTRRTQIGFEYEPVSRSFKVGFGILLAILLFVVLFPELHAVAAVLASVFPVFFLSGLITLSLVRLGLLRSARRASDSSQSDPTRSWLLALTLFGVALLALIILIESLFSFTSFEFAIAVLTPLWNGLGTLVSWILYGLIVVILSPVFYLVSWLINRIRENGHPKSQQSQIGKLKPPVARQGPVAISPEIIALGRWIFLVIALIVLLFVVKAALNHLRALNANDGIDEVRESLDARSFLGQRLRDWLSRRREKRQKMVLEALDPSSARARYRELLSEVAFAQLDLARQPSETPDEYEMRLRAYLEQQSQQAKESDATTTPTDPAILDELTRMYTRERYGGKQTVGQERFYLQSWVPHLIARLKGRPPTRS
jgi:MFS family permease